MKPLFRCDYCKEIGTAEEIESHEKECLYNPILKGCLSCSKCDFRYGDVWCRKNAEDTTYDAVHIGRPVKNCPDHVQGKPRVWRGM